jgi:hypothetical protein
MRTRHPDLRASLQQEFGHMEFAGECRISQRCRAELFVTRVEVGPVVEKDRGRFDLACRANR